MNDANYSIYFEDNITIWNKHLQDVKSYINTNNVKPSTISEDGNIKKMAVWICNQQKHYVSKTGIMNNEQIYNTWTEFVENSEYTTYFEENIIVWQRKLSDVKLYLDVNKNRPSKHSENTEIKQLGYWISNQQIKFQKKLGEKRRRRIGFPHVSSLCY